MSMNETGPLKPILYLDVDGVILTYKSLTQFGPALGLKDFMRFALEHFEVRWCTSWAVSGVMGPTNLEDLAHLTKLPVETWMQIKPSLPWHNYKTEAIDWNEIKEGRTFVWIEDEILPEEEEKLHELGYFHCYYYTDVIADKNALLNTWGELIKVELTWLKALEQRLLNEPESSESFKYPLSRGGNCKKCHITISEGAETYAKGHHVYCSPKCLKEATNE